MKYLTMILATFALPALANVRAARLFTDGVQALRAHQRLQLSVACAAWRLRANPLWVLRGDENLFGVAWRSTKHWQLSTDQRRPGH